MSLNQVDLTSNAYDEWSRYYDKGNNEIDSIVKKVGGFPWKGKRVLEIGCGTGRFTEKILDEAIEVVAVDIDDDRLEILRKKLKINQTGEKCKVLSGELYDFTDELSGMDFDCILFTWSWRFIHQQGKADRVFTALKKMIAPEHCILSTMAIGGQWEDTIDLIVGTKEENREINLNKTAMDYLKRLFESIGLDFIDFVQTNYFEFSSVAIAQKLAFDMSGVNADKYDLVGRIIGKFADCDGKVHISDEIQCLFAKTRNWRMANV